MKHQLLFEDATQAQIDLAKAIRGRILSDLMTLSIEEFNQVNTVGFSKKVIMNYISYKDDVYFFIQFKNVESYTAIINTILKMNREK